MIHNNIQYALKFIWIIIVIFMSHLYMGQSPVSGIVKDYDTRLPLLGTSVSIRLKSDSLHQRLVRTDDQGYFSIPYVRAGAYEMTIHQDGYQTWTSSLTVVNKAIRVQEIYLQVLESKIQAVHLKPLSIKMGSDTIQYAATGFRKKHDEYAEDLIKHLPGLFKDPDGTLSIRGKEIEQVLVNGQKFFGDDKNKALQQIPAELISKIEVYDGESNQSKISGIQDGLKTTTLNIITKKKKSLFGDLQGGISLNSYHNISGSINTLGNTMDVSVIGQDDNANLSGSGNHKFPTANHSGLTRKQQAGINVSYSKSPKLSFNGSLQFNAARSNIAQRDERTTFLPGDIIQEDHSENLSGRKNRTIQFNYAVISKIDTLTTLTINTNLQQYSNQSNANSTSEIFQDKAATNTITNDINSHLKGFTGYINTSLNHQFRKKGRSTSISLYYNLNRSKQNDSTHTYTVLEAQPLDRNIKSKIINTTFSTNANYTEPISRQGALLTQYTYSQAQGSSTRLTSPLYGLPSDVQMNHSNSDTHIYQGFIKYQYKRESYNWSGSINVQNNRITSDESSNSISNTAVFPELMISYTPNNQRSYVFNYRGTITPPSGTMLQPIIDNSNPAFVRLGNPDLKSSITHSFDLSSNILNAQSQPLMFNVNAVIQQNAIADELLIGTDGFQTIKPDNVNGNYALSLNVSKSLVVKRLDVDLNLNTTISFRQAVNAINGVQNHNRISVIQQTIALSKDIGEDLEINLNLQPMVTISNATITSLQRHYFSSKAVLDTSWKKGLWKLSAYGTYLYYGKFNQSSAIDTLTFNFFGERKISEKFPLFLNIAVYNIFNEKETINRVVSEWMLLDSKKNAQPFYMMVGARWNIFKSID